MSIETLKGTHTLCTTIIKSQWPLEFIFIMKEEDLYVFLGLICILLTHYVILSLQDRGRFHSALTSKQSIFLFPGMPYSLWYGHKKYFAKESLYLSYIQQSK